MNKPPEKLRVVCESNGKVWSWNSNDSLSDLDKHAVGERPFSEHFYTLEKPMTQKTENLTTEEAWAAMARGECVKCVDAIHRIDRNHVEFWTGSHDRWQETNYLNPGPYSIVPDPSKPKEVELGEYEKDRVKVVEASLYLALEDERSNMICFIEKHFEKRKP